MDKNVGNHHFICSKLCGELRGSVITVGNHIQCSPGELCIKINENNRKSLETKLELPLWNATWKPQHHSTKGFLEFPL